jgi:hypothetical protein
MINFCVFMYSVYFHPENEHHQHRPKADVSYSILFPFGIFWNEVKKYGVQASPCCKLFWTGNVSDMFASLDPTMCLSKHVLIDITNFVDVPYWMRMYKILLLNRLMYCYIVRVFTFPVFVLTNAEYLISMWYVMLNFTPNANIFGGSEVYCKHIHCIPNQIWCLNVQQISRNQKHDWYWEEASHMEVAQCLWETVESNYKYIYFLRLIIL